MNRITIAIAAAWLVACSPSAEHQARGPLLATLKDPSSVQFRNEVLKRSVLCGEFNAKNGMGGYVGFVRFIARPGSVAMEGQPITHWDRSVDESGLSEARTAARVRASDRAVLDSTGRLVFPAEVLQPIESAAEFGFLWRWHCERN